MRLPFVKLGRATFWKPEQLNNMTEIQQALKELYIWQQINKNKKKNASQIEMMYAEKRRQTYEQRLLPYIDACISTNMVRKQGSLNLEK